MAAANGIIFAYTASPSLRQLVAHRTAASLPIAGRYRLVDFALSSMMNAGIHDVGLIMQRDYQSLLDHVGSGKAWDMSRQDGGLRLLPPFGLPEYHNGNYFGTMEALVAVANYIRSIKQENIVLFLGNLLANIDLQAAITQHEHSGAGITAICSDREPADVHYRYVPDGDGFASALRFAGEGEGLASLECYIIRKELLLEIIEDATVNNRHRFHREVIAPMLENGGRMGIYVHSGYVSFCRTAESYFSTSMDLLDPKCRQELFIRPVRTREVEGVSTYYGEHAFARNCLIADNCIIEGELENCVVFSGARISAGSKLKNCIVMRDCIISPNVSLEYVIVDKYCSFSSGTVLTGTAKLPTVVPRDTVI